MRPRDEADAAGAAFQKAQSRAGAGEKPVSRKTQRTVEQVVAQRRERLGSRRDMRSLIFRLVFLAAVAYLVLTQGFLITQNHGQGMFPALKDGDLCIAFRTQVQTLLKQKYARNDIVIYRVDDGAAPTRAANPLRTWLAQYIPEEWLPPEPAGTRYFGRVVAAAGDVVNITDTGALIVNGTTQGGEIMFPTELRGDLEYPYRVPEGCLYVLGDYRTNAKDSRDFGPIPLEAVEGKVITFLRRRGL